jgi:hypothetical protein
MLKTIVRRILVAAGLVLLPFGQAAAQKFDYSWAYDPITHQPILVCVNCWFWSCDCGSSET